MKVKPYKIKENKPSTVFEELVQYVAENGVQKSIKPTFKTDDTALYVGDCLEVLSRVTLLHCGLSASIPNAMAA